MSVSLASHQRNITMQREPPILILASRPAPCVTLESDVTLVGPYSPALASFIEMITALK